MRYAAAYGNINIMKMLLDKGISVDARSDYNQTPLMAAASFGQTQMAEFLITKGANVNASGNCGYLWRSYNW